MAVVCTHTSHRWTLGARLSDRRFYLFVKASASVGPWGEGAELRGSSEAPEISGLLVSLSRSLTLTAQAPFRLDDSEWRGTWSPSSLRSKKCRNLSDFRKGRSSRDGRIVG